MDGQLKFMGAERGWVFTPGMRSVAHWGKGGINVKLSVFPFEYIVYRHLEKPEATLFLLILVFSKLDHHHFTSVSSRLISDFNLAHQLALRLFLLAESIEPL